MLSTWERFERLKLPPQVISVSRSGPARENNAPNGTFFLPKISRPITR
jgi:hypothetical protein